MTLWAAGIVLAIFTALVAIEVGALYPSDLLHDGSVEIGAGCGPRQRDQIAIHTVERVTEIPASEGGFVKIATPPGDWRTILEPVGTRLRVEGGEEWAKRVHIDTCEMTEMSWTFESHVPGLVRHLRVSMEEPEPVH